MKCIERPADKIDVIVVYKIDCLTRSLTEFAKLVKLFDKHGVSFVSVTQRFNTTTSMGRLTLNVLLSFVQFEREVISERICDNHESVAWPRSATIPKSARSQSIRPRRRKVRTIFRSYLKLGGLNPLMTNLRKQGIVTTRRALKSGKTVEASHSRAARLPYMLRNQCYIGEVVFKGETLRGEQRAIIDRKLFDAVQAKLDGQLRRYKQKRASSEAILAGRLFDDRGQRMTPTHPHKGATKFRYYVSSTLVQGQSEEAGSISRTSAPAIEALVRKPVRDRLDLFADLDDKALVRNHVTQVALHLNQLIVELAKRSGSKGKQRPKIEVPWRKIRSTGRREILLPEIPSSHPTRPIRSENRAHLVASISKGRLWVSEFMTEPAITVEVIAQREGCSVRKVNMTFSLAFLAPDLIKGGHRRSPVLWNGCHAPLRTPT